MTTLSLALALAAAAPLATPPAPPTSFAADVAVGAPISDGNLTLFPLTPRAASKAPDVATLDEALRAKALAVEEVSASGTVNALRVENRGDRPVLLVAGELLLGGKQDRIVGRSLVLAPRSRQDVPVFCVEHGRWSGPAAFESGGAMGHAGLRKAALGGGGQREVWDEVARANARLGTTNGSDTYRAAARKLRGDTGEVARRLSGAIARTGDAAGLAVAIDGEVVAVEWFASPEVFGRIREKLVASYVAQAQEARAAAPSGAAPAAAPAAVTDFAARAEQGEAIVEKVRASGDGAAVQTTYLKR
jgi:hypothetical protein